MSEWLPFWNRWNFSVCLLFA